jgi:cysteinyl-tRNA synthetase
MAILVYNTLTHAKEEFVPRDPGKVSIYACGLTPQGPAHLGHLRGAVAFDAIRRWFTYRGYEVTMVQNFTDIDDKIIRKAAEEGVDPAELAARYAGAYLNDWNRLNLLPVMFVKVTENMDSIVSLIEDLVRRGHAYVAENSDVYFSVRTFAEYGKLSRRDPDDMEAGARIEVDPAKREPMDFALWKAHRPGEPSWPSPWGPGRPGWHIECSALSLKYLGPAFDIHAGGIDLVFPHHENEIAQSEAACDVHPFARIWMHWGAVNTGGVKMSKSLGNFFTIDEILQQYPADVLRLYVLSTHYRSPIEYQPERLAESARSYDRVKTALTVASQIAAGVSGDQDQEFFTRFGAAMDDDFNTAQALGVVFEAVGELNKASATASPDQALVSGLADTVRGMLMHLGIAVESEASVAGGDNLVAEVIEKAIAWRKMAREAKQYALGDQIRADLKELGIVLEDRPQGTTWRRE